VQNQRTNLHVLTFLRLVTRLSWIRALRAASGSGLSKTKTSLHHDGARRPAENLVVMDELPETVPISTRELEVIETYLGQLFDEVWPAKTEEPNPVCAMPLRRRASQS
jgi:hypothetical protein